MTANMLQQITLFDKPPELPCTWLHPGFSMARNVFRMDLVDRSPERLAGLQVPGLAYKSDRGGIWPATIDGVTLTAKGFFYLVQWTEVWPPSPYYRPTEPYTANCGLYIHESVIEQARQTGGVIGMAPVVVEKPPRRGRRMKDEEGEGVEHSCERPR